MTSPRTSELTVDTWESTNNSANRRAAAGSQPVSSKDLTVSHGVSSDKEKAPVPTSVSLGQEDKVLMLLSTVKCTHFSTLTSTSKEKEELLPLPTIQLPEDHTTIIG